MSINDNDIRRRLIEQRKKKRISQEDLAAELKTSRGTIAKIELGSIALSSDWTNRIAAALDMHVAVLLAPKGEDEGMTPMIWAVKTMLKAFEKRVKANSRCSIEEYAVQCSRAVRWAYMNQVLEQAIIEAKVREYLDC